MKLKFIVYLLLFTLLIGGAYVAYDALSGMGEDSNLQFVGDGGKKDPTGDTAQKPSDTPQNPSQPPEQTPPVQTPGETPGETPSETPDPTPSDPPAQEDPGIDTVPNDQEQKPPEALPAPPAAQPTVKDFTVYDESGKAVKLSEHFGRPIVINFFASWCGPCRSEMPYFQTHYIANRSEVDFLFISLDDTMAAAKKFVSGQGYTFPILHDRLGSAAAAYDVGAIPATYFINAEGELVAWAVGALSYADLSRAIEKIK